MIVIRSPLNVRYIYTVYKGCNFYRLLLLVASSPSVLYLAFVLIVFSMMENEN